jgi:hypothetical protein
LACAGVCLLAASFSSAASRAGEIVFDGTWETANPASPWREIHTSYGGGAYNFVKDPPRKGTVAVVTLPPNGDAAIEAIHHSPFIVGSTTVYGLAFKFPRDWQVPSDDWGCLIAQFGYPLLKYTNIALGVGANYVGLEMHTGSIDWHGRKPSAEAPATFDLYRRYTSPGNYVIPPSRFKTGVWHLLVIEIKWATDRTGSLRAWHQIEGETSWTETVDFEQIPTMQWGNGISGGYMGRDGKDENGEPKVVSDKVGAYRYEGDQPFVVYNDGLLIGTDAGTIAQRIQGTSFQPVVRRLRPSPIVVGRLYSTPLTARGGVLPLRWSVTRGALPPGIRLAPNKGIVAGRAKQAGKWRVVLTAQDALGGRSSRAVTLRVRP